MATVPELKSQLPDVVRKLRDTYQSCGRIDHLDHSPLPNRDVIAKICEDFKEILYPGYGRRQGLTTATVSYHVGDVLESLYDKLGEQIVRALRHEHVESGQGGPADLDRRAQQIALEVLQDLPDMRARLAMDAEAAVGGDPAARGLDEVIFCYPGMEAITIYRVAHQLHVRGVPLVPRMMTELAHSKTGIDIHPGATIGPSFFIDHGTGVVVGETTVIGENVKLYQGVTLGALSFPTDPTGQLIRGRKRHPAIGDNVVIYANATLLGDKTVIGDNVVIGSSVWLTRPVPSNTTVVLEKPQLRMRSDLHDPKADHPLNFQI